MHIVIIGGSFGGLTTAFDLRRLLPRGQHEITLISKERRFIFIPSLPWVAMGEKTIADISFDLERPLTSKGINFVAAAVDRIDPEARKVHTDSESYDYDYLVIATGHRSANEAVEGLGPFDGPGHSLMSPPEAEEASETWSAYLDDPGPMVIGCAPGASCLGPAYEFLFETHHALKQRSLCHKAPITFVTPEPFLGHFGIGGFGKIRQFLEGELEDRDVRYHTSAEISKITDNSVEMEDGTVFESRYSLIIPPLAGVKPVAEAEGLANPKGFIQVDPNYRHKDFENIYAVGVAVALPPVEETPVPVNFPKTGHMTEQMAKIAARNIAADILGGEKTSHDLMAECIMSMGDQGAHIVADPVRPPRNVSELSNGKRWLLAKKFFSNYYLWKMKRGATRSPKWVW
ncbi:MAG: FAD-dependent oxidoreductase [Rhodospirillales bacterium]|jgi:sulfide:quinone oxidoreductase|nr:sulfide:quinone reductase [Rhodospirillaceae bacterium]MDP6643609.1 FAD-dependent oxidoreductase [Rhodospirillales bacterium]MDP6842287.1 FAD-dependent oxidoreductase [Rhodospirillales bacterium]